MPKPKTTRIIRRIIPFGMIWFVMSLIYVFIERGLLADLTYYPASKSPYDFSLNLMIVPLASTITGLLFGTLEILVLKNLFRRLSLFMKVILKSFIYIIGIILFLIFTSFIANTFFASVYATEEVYENLREFYWSAGFWSIILYISVISLITVLISDLSDHIGQGVLINFIFGRYHKPLTEDRVFMFLDMESSTAITEQLGHRRYFDFLQLYFATMSDAIIEFQGEVYQYAGDEIIVSWPLDKGIKNNACIHMFFAIKAAFEEKASVFKNRFQVQPSFKAAFHCGSVTSGEIGEIKKEILYTGDVLNTTARLQGLCKVLQSDLLISESLLLFLDFRKDYVLEDKGIFDLKGKERTVRIFAVGRAKS